MSYRLHTTREYTVLYNQDGYDIPLEEFNELINKIEDNELFEIHKLDGDDSYEIYFDSLKDFIETDKNEMDRILTEKEYKLLHEIYTEQLDCIRGSGYFVVSYC